MIKKEPTEHEDEVTEIESEEIDARDQQIVDLEQRLEETENKYRRALADYQNLQKRSQDERITLIRSANKDLLLRILSVFDTLLLAQNHLQDKNLEVSTNHFLDVLKSEGVTRIAVIGKDFDPAIMEAIATVEGEENKVINEARVGFMLNEHLLRAAQVTVGKELRT
ncbi:MAG: nucleotide exchange factor GrpE [Candidatus Levybacteria bacterium]|nr:nucleotide exchange factor GrpE [Candidatus Levybacteria bacterium]